MGANNSINGDASVVAYTSGKLVLINDIFFITIKLSTLFKLTKQCGNV